MGGSWERAEPRELYCDRRIGGVERLVSIGPRETLVRVPDTILDCSVFLGLQDAAGDVRRIGTGFFVGVPVQ